MEVKQRSAQSHTGISQLWLIIFLVNPPYLQWIAWNWTAMYHVEFAADVNLTSHCVPKTNQLCSKRWQIRAGFATVTSIGPMSLLFLLCFLSLSCMFSGSKRQSSHLKWISSLHRLTAQIQVSLCWWRSAYFWINIHLCDKAQKYCIQSFPIGPCLPKAQVIILVYIMLRSRVSQQESHGLVHGSEVFLCRVCLHGFPLDTPASSHSPETCMWGMACLIPSICFY